MPTITPRRIKLTPQPPQGAVLKATTDGGRDYDVNIGRSSLRGLGEALLRLADRYDQAPRSISPTKAEYSALIERDAEDMRSKLAQSPMRFEIGVDETLSQVALQFFMRDPGEPKRIIQLSMEMPPADAEMIISALRQAVTVVEAKPSGASQ